MSRAARQLPPPLWQRLGALGDALVGRRSVRRFSSDGISDEDLSLLLASAGGITDPVRGLRSAPSGGACYPLEIYLVSKHGVEQYVPERNSLIPAKGADVRADLARHSYNQSFLADAPVTVAICAEYPRITGRYGRRGIRYAILEAGHVAQNLHLAAQALGYGSVAVGAYDDEGVKEALGVAGDVLYLIPVGRPR
ncbi:MAG: SagB/ThcOx family dehydrogenase [bacterium]|nr:MAG: SagB/ThcOx family dehydrogenase [bacterium]